MIVETHIDIDRLFILVFLAAAGLASVLSHCLLRRYSVASLAASFVASVCTGEYIAAYIVLRHVSPVELSWMHEVYLPAFVFALPIAFVTGLPFLLLRRRKSTRRSVNARGLWDVPDSATVRLSIALCALFFGSVVVVYQRMQWEQIEGTVYVAARNGTPTDIQNALSVGGNLNSRLGYGTTPLMIASFYGRTDNVAFLLKKGADPNVVCPEGETALKWALQNKHYDVAALLRQAGAKK